MPAISSATHLTRGHYSADSLLVDAQALGMDLADVQEVVHQLDLAGGIGDGSGDLVDGSRQTSTPFSRSTRARLSCSSCAILGGAVVEQRRTAIERGGRRAFRLTLPGRCSRTCAEATDLGKIRFGMPGLHGSFPRDGGAMRSHPNGLVTAAGNHVG
ncbi:MAG: hypothetical protein ACLUEU_01090 [Oscillospiraceae bacterium]